MKVLNVNKDNLAVRERKSVIKNSLRPFNKDAYPDRLFNICTGDHVRKVLMNPF